MDDKRKGRKKRRWMERRTIKEEREGGTMKVRMKMKQEDDEEEEEREGSDRGNELEEDKRRQEGRK